MKTILTSHGEEIRRVPDKVASNLVRNKKAVYCPKKFWKDAQKQVAQSEWDFANARK